MFNNIQGASTSIIQSVQYIITCLWSKLKPIPAIDMPRARRRHRDSRSRSKSSTNYREKRRRIEVDDSRKSTRSTNFFSRFGRLSIGDIKNEKVIDLPSDPRR
ncbi:hypothetical protein Bhyg_10955 [Pseudolycoriella hygida]|uniref:Uncharacterized protein n=1 Tax=Pseudolycoriella hygida TaxID=35572 RepID=A0A9Q0RZ60_9DIPT|nr:hypothetical protein Bhyg_10955 [Pseudolycoriella hygida]